jgi:hypothetical protein
MGSSTGRVKDAIPITSVEDAAVCQPWSSFGPFGGLGGRPFDIKPPSCSYRLYAISLTGTDDLVT